MSFQQDEIQALTESIANKFMKAIRALFGLFKDRDRNLTGQLGPLPISPKVVQGLIGLKKIYANPYISDSLRAQVGMIIDTVAEPIASMYSDIPAYIDDILKLTEARPGQPEVIDSGLMFPDGDEEDDASEGL